VSEEPQNSESVFSIRNQLVEELCAFSQVQATTFLEKARFYLETLEDFIDKEKKHEIANLEKEARKLPEPQRGSFWADYYPIHWEDIFEYQLRSSFIVSLMSFFEDRLKIICWEVAVIEQASEDPRTWNRAIIKTGRRFLREHGFMPEPLDSEWGLLYKLYDLRNVFVHAGGHLNGPNDTSKVRQLISSQPGISEQNGFIEIRKEFCFFTLDLIRRVIHTLHTDQVAFCERAG